MRTLQGIYWKNIVIVNSLVWKAEKVRKILIKEFHILIKKKEKTIIFDNYILYWINKENDENDEKQVIISKFFIDDEYDHLTKREKINDSKDENDMNNSKINKKIKFYQSFCYNAICDSKNKKEMEYKDWKAINFRIFKSYFWNNKKW